LSTPRLSDDASTWCRASTMIARVNAPLPREAEPALTFTVEKS